MVRVVLYVYFGDVTDESRTNIVEYSILKSICI